MTGLVITLVVGTDHHPFERLVSWADERARTHPEDRVTIQYGYTRPPTAASGVELISPDELHTLLAASDVVVTHGGPGTVMGARNAGHHPLVLARDPAFGEHVDEHQVRFSRWASGKGLVHLVEDLAELDTALATLGTPGTRADTTGGHGTERAAALVPALLAQLEAGERVVVPGSQPVLAVVGEDASRLEAEAAAWATQPGTVVLGDVLSLFTRPAPDCAACGEPLTHCAVWQPWLSAAFGDDLLPGPGLTDAWALARKALSPHRLSLQALGRRRSATDRAAVLDVTGSLRRLCSAACETTGADQCVLVGGIDAALLLSRDRALDLRVVPVGAPAGSGAAHRGLRGLRRQRVPLLPLLGQAATSDTTPHMIRPSGRTL